MLHEKKDEPVENNEYYTDDTIDETSVYGKNLYDDINVGTIHLRIALANLK